MTEVKATAASRDASEGASPAAPDLVALGDTGLACGDRIGCCGGGSGSWSPPSLPADTRLKRLVDRFLPWAGLPVILYFAAAIGAPMRMAISTARERTAERRPLIFWKSSSRPACLRLS